MTRSELDLHAAVPDDFDAADEAKILEFIAGVLERLRRVVEGNDLTILESAHRLACQMHTRRLAQGLVSNSESAHHATEERDSYPEVERRGLLEVLPLRIRIVKSPFPDKPNMIGVSGDVPDVLGEKSPGWSHLREISQGETRYESLRLALREFFDHEIDHALWLDGEPLFNAHPQEDGDPESEPDEKGSD
jgi:hypothetical protein